MIQKFIDIAKKNNSLVCLGLDPDVSKLPVGQDQLSFNKAIIDATHDVVCCYKPNSAFYEALGVEGIQNLKDTCEYIRNNYPGIPIILDAKRADIGNTNEGYIQFIYNYLGVDAVTLHPYMGQAAIQPFLDVEDRGAIILCRTSNDGAGEFQDLEMAGEPLYQKVARNIAEKWNSNKNCMLVVGATYPEEAKQIRKIVGEDIWFLIPGAGAQGGDVEAAVKSARNSLGMGFVMNSSRGIIFASSGPDFAEVARTKTIELRDEINKYR